jgi:hypothetical protein
LPGAELKEKRAPEFRWGSDITVSGKPVRLVDLPARAREWVLLID